jgi:hypothetical protein
MALLSRACSGSRSGGLDGCGRVGVALESWLWGFSRLDRGLLLRERLTPPRMAALILRRAKQRLHSSRARDDCITIMLCGHELEGKGYAITDFHANFSSLKAIVYFLPI